MVTYLGTPWTSAGPASVEWAETTCSAPLPSRDEFEPRHIRHDWQAHKDREPA